MYCNVVGVCWCKGKRWGRQGGKGGEEKRESDSSSGAKPVAVLLVTTTLTLWQSGQCLPR